VWSLAKKEVKLSELTVSYSAFSTFKACKKKHYFRKELGLEPKHDAPEVSVGKIIHDGFEKLFLGTSHQDCSKFIGEQFDKALAENLNPYDHEDLTVNKYIALGMWMHYPQDQIKFDRVYPEQRFKIPVPGFPNVYYVGYLDGLVFDKGHWWVREVKTTGLGIREMKSRADMSYQSTSYIWAMQQILRSPVKGVIYDIIRKPLLRKNQKEDAIGFGERCFDYYREPKNSQKLYATHYSWRSKDVLRAFQDDLVADTEDMLSARQKGYWSRNPDACFMYGRECPYKRICFLESPDQDMLDAYYRKRKGRTEAGNTLTLTECNL
jgi:hypothetical protein